MDPLVLLSLAVAPGLAISIFVYWRDKFEKEPRGILIWSFILGALSIFPAIFFETVVEQLGLSGTDIFSNAIENFIGVALIEEGCKFYMVRRYAYQQAAFNEPYDGITYAVMVSMGFATLENISYVFQYGVGNALLRMVTAVPAHATFGVIMGYYLGMAKFKNNKLHLMFMALFVPTLMHGFYDFSLTEENIPLMSGGAFLSLILGIIYSLKAIHTHSVNSPFRNLIVLHDNIEERQSEAKK